MFSVTEVISSYYPSLANKPWLFNPLTTLLKKLLHEKEFINFAELYPYLQGMDFVEQVLEHFEFSYSVRNKEKERIPSTGRVVIIANHPIGSLDGLALLKLITEVRSDVKVVANQMLMALKPLHPMLLPVNNMQGGTFRGCITGMSNHLKNEGALIIFPAGEVSRLGSKGVRDGKWHGGFLKLARSNKAPILPVLIEGKNSSVFYGLSLIYRPLGTLLLVKEMFKQRSKHLPVRIGEIIPYESFGAAKISVTQQVKLFKKHLYLIPKKKPLVFLTQKAIALPENRKDLSQSIQKECEHLGETGDGKDIYLYRYQDSSPILREIGRLREVAFRAVGEGSHQRRDTDRYDRHYLHLILWDKKDLEIVGAYRLGESQKIVDKFGIEGLYTSSLFTFYPCMDVVLANGLELGRSFVQPQYWGKRSLDYLWLGIGAFLKKYPHYRYLFGPVSISNSYPKAAKDLLIEFYQLYFHSSERFASSKSPYQMDEAPFKTFSGSDYREDFIQLKSLLANIGVAVPVLYKQYSELYEPGGVKFLAFGLDTEFSDCVDGLALADITALKTSKRLRYMG